MTKGRSLLSTILAGPCFLTRFKLLPRSPRPWRKTSRGHFPLDGFKEGLYSRYSYPWDLSFGWKLSSVCREAFDGAFFFGFAPSEIKTERARRLVVLKICNEDFEFMDLLI